MKQKLLFLLALMLLAVGPLRAQSQMIKDIGPDVLNVPYLPPYSTSNITLAVAMNGIVYFSADDGVHGQELWRSDGTEAGTYMVKDINAGSGSAFASYPYSRNKMLCELNGLLYFVATDADNDQEIWKSDGTAAGTVKVTNLQEPGQTKLDNAGFAHFNGALYFSFNDGVHGHELWKTNGTAAGTVMVKDILPAGMGILPSYMVNYNDRLYFGSTYYNELWQTDGTAAGTVLVKELPSATRSEFVKFKGELYFTVDNALWKSNGTAAGTQLVKNGIHPILTQGGATSDGIYFTTDVSLELWRTDGTAEGTTLFKDLNPGPSTSSPRDFVSLNGKLYFSAFDGKHGRELWISNGTPAGTTLAEDIVPGVFGSSPEHMTVFGQNLFFSANNGLVGGQMGYDNHEPWKFTPYPDGPPAIAAFTPASGREGTVVTLTGTGFLGAQAVRFNGVAATDFTVLGYNKIKVTVPLGASTGPISVTQGGITANSSNFTFYNSIYLNSFTPPRHAPAVPKQSNVALTFSQAISSATASGTALKVYGSQTGLRSGNFSGGGTSTVTFDPAKDFYAGEKVSVSVTKNVHSTGGDSLVKPQVLQFTAATAPAPATFAPKAGLINIKATADVDGDGDVDLIVRRLGTQISVHLNDGKGNFTEEISVPLTQWPEFVTMADLDGDGDSDMAFTFGTGHLMPGGVSIYLNDGTGEFTAADSYTLPWSPTAIKAGDFDGDGHLDLAVAAPNATNNDYFGTYKVGFVHILFNNGNAGFPRSSATAEADNQGDIEIADLDGDGDLDLISSQTIVTRGGWTVYLNDGTGEFTRMQYIETGMDPSLHLADLDGDGDADLVSMVIGSPEQGERYYVVYLNNGAGFFQGHTSFFLGGYSGTGIAVGDFDGDGDADFAASNAYQEDPYGADTLVVFVNDGSANFSARQSPIRSGEYQLQSADLDGDGDLDLIGYQRLFFNGGLPATSTVTLSSFAPMSAPVGAGVAIRGTNFTAGSTVRFNGVAATQVSFESPTLLIATVPAGASSGSIQVSNANGTATSTGSLTVAEVSSLWQVKSAMSTARTQHGAVAISSNGRVYAFGGTNGTELSSLEIYNTNAFAWSAGAPIPTPTRGGAFVRGTDNQIYLFSGYGGGSNRSQSYKYNPLTNVWTSLASLFTPVWAASAAASGHLIYVFGGQTAAGTASNQVQIYNTQTNAWTSGAAMPTALMQHQAVTSYNGKIYLFGGRTAAQGGLSDGVQIYNPSTNSWSTGASMPVPKAQFGTVLNNDGRIFLVGGRGSYVPNQGPFFHTVEIYDPKTNSWSEGPALPSAVGGQTVVNSYGNLFMMGGIDGSYRNYNWRLVLPPVAPTSAKATAISASQIKVEWVDAAGNENRYEVERATSASGPWTVIATTAANAITYTDGNRAANTTYFYRVRGGNSSGYGAYSAIVSATTWATGANARESVEEEATSLNLQAAPNPFHSQTTVSFTAIESGQAVLDLYDLQGKKLQRVFDAQVQAGEQHKAEVKGSRLNQGIYLLRLANGSQCSYLRLLIEK